MKNQNSKVKPQIVFYNWITVIQSELEKITIIVEEAETDSFLYFYKERNVDIEVYALNERWKNKL